MTTHKSFGSFSEGPFHFLGAGFPGGVLLRSDLEAVNGFFPEPAHTGTGAPAGPFLAHLGTTAASAAPLTEARLHRQFADLRTDDDFSEFMKNWGWLTSPWLLKQTKAKPPSDGVYGEPLRIWKSAVAEIWAALRMFDMVDGGANDQLSRFIKWHPETVSVSYSVIELDSNLEIVPWSEWDRMREAGELDVEGGPTTIIGRTQKIADSVTGPALFGDLRRGSLLDPLGRYLSKLIGRQLAGAVSPQVFPEKKFEWYLVPRNLLTVIWLQFMREFCGEHLLSRCRFCASWVQGQRKTRDYCDDRCRQAGYRRRASSKIKA